MGTFNRSMRALSSNHEAPLAGGRYVLTLRTPFDEPDPREIIFKRRRIFCGMLGGLAFSLPASLVPGLGFLLWAGIALALGLAGFTAFLISEKNKRPQRPAASHEREEPVRRIDEIPSVLRLPVTPPVRIMEYGSRPVYIIEDDVLAEDDGLSELGWAQAGRY